MPTDAAPFVVGFTVPLGDPSLRPEDDSNTDDYSTNFHGAPPLKLSVCISTLNRAAFIGATLDSILGQATPECEIVVLDCGSTDNTEQVVASYARRFNQLRYVKQGANYGIDRDYDRVVELALGDYCWLMTDDDQLKPGALETVLDALRQDVSLVIVNAEAKDLTMSLVLQDRILNFDSDRKYSPRESERLFVEVKKICHYIGAVIIRRDVWLGRERKAYYGSLFIHLGVIFQRQLPQFTVVIAKPLVSYRMGNAHTFSSTFFETFMIRLPTLVWSLPLSDAAKRQVLNATPWKNFLELLRWRGLGSYSMTEYRLLLRPRIRSIRDRFVPFFVAILPGSLVNAILVLYYTMRPVRHRGVWRSKFVLHGLKNSRFYFRNGPFSKH